MKKITFFALVVFAFTFQPAVADTFDFSYKFAVTSGSVRGTLSGDQVGDSTTGFIENVTVQSLFIDDIEVLGPLFNAHYDYSSFVFIDGGIVSFDLSQNNFAFSAFDFSLGSYPSDPKYFEISGSPPSPYSSIATAYWSVLDPYDYRFETDSANGVWSLVNTTKSVPDAIPTFFPVLAGFGLVGAAARRARFAKG